MLPWLLSGGAVSVNMMENNLLNVKSMADYCPVRP